MANVVVPLDGLQKIAYTVYKNGNDKVKQIVLIIELNVSKRGIKNKNAILTEKEYAYLKKEYEYVL